MMHGQGYPIPIHQFDSALAHLSSLPAQSFRANYGNACGLCTQSDASRRFLLAMLDLMIQLHNAGRDFSIPLVLLSGTMLQTGYEMGRKRAEAEILEGWMKL
jgi:hypothetical protein